MSDPTTASVWITAAASGLVGAAIGGAITCLTVRQQLRHAASEARIARDHALKREVCFETAEAVAGWVRLLSNISRVDLTVQQLSETQGANPGWSYKVHAVGDLDTIKALDRAGEFVFSRVLDLMVKRMHLDTLRSATATASERATQLFTYAQQVVAAIQAISAADAAPEARAVAQQLTQDLRDMQAEHAELAARWHQASEDESRAHRELFLASMKAISEHQRYLSDVVVNVRRELDLPFDAEDYLAHIAQTSDRALEELQKMMDQLDS